MLLKSKCEALITISNSRTSDRFCFVFLPHRNSTACLLTSKTPGFISIRYDVRLPAVTAELNQDTLNDPETQQC